jgi:hypothetical protein
MLLLDNVRAVGGLQGPESQQRVPRGGRAFLNAVARSNRAGVTRTRQANPVGRPLAESTCEVLGSHAKLAHRTAPVGVIEAWGERLSPMEVLHGRK